MQPATCFHNHIPKFGATETNNVVNDPKMPAPGSEEWHQIEAIARWKFDGINGRVQTFSFGIASVALFGRHHQDLVIYYFCTI